MPMKSRMRRSDPELGSPTFPEEVRRPPHRVDDAAKVRNDAIEDVTLSEYEREIARIDAATRSRR